MEELKLIRREEILEGTLEVPMQIVNLVGFNYVNEIVELWDAMWHNYLSRKSTTSVPYWADKWSNQEKFGELTYHLSKSGWCTVVMDSSRNWGEISLNESKLLTYLSIEELTDVRRGFKGKKYMPRKSMKSKTIETSSLTKVNGKKMSTGITREGFALAGTSEFKYDVEAIKANRFVIEKNLVKSMEKLSIKLGKTYDEFNDDLHYAGICRDVLQMVIDNESEVYTTGINISDSRGRAISTVLKQVFNPIANKDARSCLSIVNGKEMTDRALQTVYLFIAELVGCELTTEENKAKDGFTYYQERKLLELDCFNEDDRKDWHENIWLTRLYDELDRYFEHTTNNRAGKFIWLVPVELDAGASIIEYSAVLTGHRPYMEATNLIGGTIQDPWSRGNISRLKYKLVATPRMYGSSASPQTLWSGNGQVGTPEEIKFMNKEVSTGFLSVANKFKDFIIKHNNMKVITDVEIFREKFKVHCNKFKSVGEYCQSYTAWDTSKNMFQTIHHTHTKRVPDLDAFKLYPVSLLTHNLDSQTEDKVCLDEMRSKNGWCIPIHDATLCSPVSGDKVRESYGRVLESIYENREAILMNFFKSIGIDMKVAMSDWLQVLRAIEPFEGTFKCGYMALK